VQHAVQLAILVSGEMVALYLLASVVAIDTGVTIRDVVPIFTGKSKEWSLTNGVDCLPTVVRRQVKIGS
jgi:hypothetical protein